MIESRDPLVVFIAAFAPVIVLFYAFRWQRRILHKNFSNVAQILGTSVETRYYWNLFPAHVVEAVYKGRKVVFWALKLSSESASIYIIPVASSQTNPWNILSSYKPTENTSYSAAENKLYWAKNLFKLPRLSQASFKKRILAEEELRSVLNDLVLGAEKVESKLAEKK